MSRWDDLADEDRRLAKYFDIYFNLFKMAREFEAIIPKLETREYRVEALKAYFELLDLLRSEEPRIREVLNILQSR